MKPNDLTDFILKVEEISKIGMKYSKDPYALDNYFLLNSLARDFLKAEYVDFDKPNFFERDIYPTPNISVRTILFSEDKTKIFLVEEKGEKPGFSLPGGWAELGLTPSESAIKECREETGYEVEIQKIVGITDRYKNIPTTGVPEYIITFQGKMIKKISEPCYEISSADFYPLVRLPVWSRKNDQEQMLRLIEAALENRVIFD